jgi:hypothetical protein
VWHNRLLVTDTQQQVAASRRMLRAGQRQRYRSNPVPSVLAIAAPSHSKRLAQHASLFRGTIPSARVVFERASRRWPAFGVHSSGSVVGGHSARAQLALPCWGANLGTLVGSVRAWSCCGHTPIQPHMRQHRGGKSCVGVQPQLALASAASDNRSPKLDAFGPTWLQR